MNIDKCHLLISKEYENISIIINDINIQCQKSAKLLGIIIDNKLSFQEHINELCKKASLKLHALARISDYMNQDKLRVLMKAFIESQFCYCSLLWMFHSRALNNKINKLHKRALRLVYKNNNLSFEELLIIDKSFTIHERNLQRLATEMFKIKNNLSPSFMKSIFPPSTHSYNLRKDVSFQSKNIHSVYHGTETITFRGPRLWGNVPIEIKNSSSLSIFKAKIRQWKPKGCQCRICKTFIPNYGFI